MTMEPESTHISVPFPNSYWVVPGQLLAGEYPGNPEPGRARRRLVNMLQSGIQVFIDLTHPMDGLEPYHAIVSREAEDLGLEVDIHPFPIEDYGIPAPLEMKAILDKIDEAVAGERRVYVHCWGGIGRTGTVVGCYLVRHGLDGEAALIKLAELRKATPKYWRDAPESDEQKQLVREWRPGR